MSSRGAEADKGQLPELEPIGVIDIGSNSVRLVIYEGAIRSPTPLFNEKVLCGLGRSVAATGRLTEEAIASALAALRRFVAITRLLEVKNVRAMATAAVRDASNGAEFIAAAETVAGMAIAVLSGQREAELAAHGIAMGFQRPDGIVGDLGGGSLELVDVSGRETRQAITLPLGGLRLIETAEGRLDRAVEIAEQQVARVAWLQVGAGRTFYAVGGAWRALARMHMERMNYPLRVMHGYSLACDQAIDLCESLRKGKKVGDLAEAAGISKARREVLPAGAVVLERVLRAMRPKEVVFSVFGIREGLVYSLLSPHERNKDPLLSFCENYACLRSRSVEHARELGAWTDAIFCSPGPTENADERRLRHAACLLSDIGWRAHPDYRGEQSLNVIAHSALSGIDHTGRAFLALTVYHRHVGPGDDSANEQLSDRLKSLASKRLQKRARILGAAIRAAHMLSFGRPGIISQTKFGYREGRLQLEVPAAYAGLDGERLRRRLGHLASVLEVHLELRFVDGASTDWFDRPTSPVIGSE